MAKILTISDLMAKKEELKTKQPKRMKLYVSSLGGEIVIQEPGRELALETINMATVPATSDKADPHIVYHCVVEPDLKNKELQTQFECTEPTDIVDMIFEPGEVSEISNFILQLSGFGGKSVKKVDEELKNS
ncbi:phage tail assembly chaperone [Paenibacillus thermotolerans]|uniref:phage tail assembly chaperone n=1 Tax=Paenibacillus thermotolerans TaxID=3027807 RepID=UPI00236880F2|nr:MULTISPECIES: hypothetical protein [unclassified Paenibacillus]